MSEASAPPPLYSAHGDTPNTHNMPTSVLTEPPPKYEPPTDGPYSQQPAPSGFAYPQGPYQGYQGQQGTVHNTIILTEHGYSGYPKQMECPNCHAFITTATSHQSGALTWLSAGLICLFGCWMGCCLIPFCIDDLQDVEHRCPNCGRHLGTYRRI